MVIISKEARKKCSECERKMRKKGKKLGCAFRRLGNEYCDEIMKFDILICATSPGRVWYCDSTMDFPVEL